MSRNYKNEVIYLIQAQRIYGHLWGDYDICKGRLKIVKTTEKTKENTKQYSDRKNVRFLS
jgi:hypothetical protein